MELSAFNVRVPFPSRDEVFLMNMLTDAQAVVSNDVAALLDRLTAVPPGNVSGLTDVEQEALAELAEQGFVVADRAAERLALERHFRDIREDASLLKITVLTTMQCNFACEYCIQAGEGGDYNRHAGRMSMATAARVGQWVEERLDRVRPRQLNLTFYGGEPLLNLPVMYELAERGWRAAQACGVKQNINVITNGLLLTPEVVDKLLPYGLAGVKITLDGDRAEHDRRRPLRGGQGTFDRIVGNIRAVAGRCKIAIGGNFDESSVANYEALLDFLKDQEFAQAISRITFKPIIRDRRAGSPGATTPAAAVVNDGPLGGTCMTLAGSGGGSQVGSCRLLDEKMSFLRTEIRKRGFQTSDGVHMGPCDIYRRHAYTIGPDGSLYACPGFAGEAAQSVGHIDSSQVGTRGQAASRFDVLAAWRNCGDCPFIPVCAGGCSVASHAELGDMSAPACHKSSFETALVSLAEDAASAK